MVPRTFNGKFSSNFLKAQKKHEIAHSGLFTGPGSKAKHLTDKHNPIHTGDADDHIRLSAAHPQKEKIQVFS